MVTILDNLAPLEMCITTAEQRRPTGDLHQAKTGLHRKGQDKISGKASKSMWHMSNLNARTFFPDGVWGGSSLLCQEIFLLFGVLAVILLPLFFLAL